MCSPGGACHFRRCSRVRRKECPQLARFSAVRQAHANAGQPDAWAERRTTEDTEDTEAESTEGGRLHGVGSTRRPPIGPRSAGEEQEPGRPRQTLCLLSHRKTSVRFGAMQTASGRNAAILSPSPLLRALRVSVVITLCLPSESNANRGQDRRSGHAPLSRCALDTCTH